jgi:hypothetical protein
VQVRDACKLVMKRCVVDLTMKGSYGGEADAAPVVSKFVPGLSWYLQGCQRMIRCWSCNTSLVMSLVAPGLSEVARLCLTHTCRYGGAAARCATDHFLHSSLHPQIVGSGALSMVKLTDCRLSISCASIRRELTLGFVHIQVGAGKASRRCWQLEGTP